MAELKKENGVTKLIVSSNCEFDDFYEFVEQLEKILKINFIKKIDDYDSLYWVFGYQDTLMVVSYDTFSGISIYPEKGKDANEDENNKVSSLKSILKL